MCGIAGIITTNQYQDSLELLAGKMQKALRQRGPDDQGVFVSQSRQAAFAHTRLSIIDLSQSGHQPMASNDGRFWIIFNGEIYNFKELRAQLEAQGEKFQSSSDTEVVLKLYQRHGADCLNKFRGMFAFAIWDELEKTCFLARDPFGIKPLYYFRDAGVLAFASELKALLATGIPARQISREGLEGYFLNGSVPEPKTIIKGVFSLPAGHWMRWQNGRLESPRQYWKIEFNPQKTTPEEAREKVHNALIDSVESHFVSDVPVGIFLSGGIDSSALVALARQTQKGKLLTYTVTFEEPGWNEGPIAKKVAQKFGTTHTEYLVTSQEASKLFDSFLENVDQPTIDGFNTYCISKIASQNGARVLLSGLGGDELFGGYPSFHKIPKMIRWNNILHTLNLSSVASNALEQSGNTHSKRLADFLCKQPSAISAYRSLRGVFSESESKSLMPQYVPGSALYSASIDAPLNSSNLKDEISYLELSSYMRNQLLRDSDVMSMAHGLELRVPFIDRVFFDAVSTIPSNLRIMPNKRLLINSVPELPKEVYNRTKQGFLFPFQKWIEKDWGNNLLHVEAPKGVSLGLWYRKWSLSVLKRWIEKNLA
jgi:asparagine synthase (glutamine-hydrolysing)